MQYLSAGLYVHHLAQIMPYVKKQVLVFVSILCVHMTSKGSVARTFPLHANTCYTNLQSMRSTTGYRATPSRPVTKSQSNTTRFAAPVVGDVGGSAGQSLVGRVLPHRAPSSQQPAIATWKKSRLDAVFRTKPATPVQKPLRKGCATCPSKPGNAPSSDDPPIGEWSPYFWYTLRAAALRAADPNREELISDEDADGLVSFFRSIGTVLPCGNCRRHYSIDFEDSPYTREHARDLQLSKQWVETVDDRVYLRSQLSKCLKDVVTTVEHKHAQKLAVNGSAESSAAGIAAATSTPPTPPPTPVVASLQRVAATFASTLAATQSKSGVIRATQTRPTPPTSKPSLFSGVDRSLGLVHQYVPARSVGTRTVPKPLPAAMLPPRPPGSRPQVPVQSSKCLACGD
jgi:hypothetical protein